MGKVDDFIGVANSKFKAKILFGPGDTQQLNIPRFSSQVLSIDNASGGGWPHGRMILLKGVESTGKSLLALKASESITNYDHRTKIHKDFVDEDLFEPGIALYVDAEAAFDIEWADRVANFSEHGHVVARPETSEETIDLVTAAMEENCFDLIVIDSIAALSPMKTLETSIEDSVVGLHARLMNEALRRWGSKITKLSREGNAPTIMLINQLRQKIGVMFGNPETCFGGLGQNYSPSVIVRQGAVKIESGEYRDNSLGTYQGTFQKNKTAKPRQSYTFKMYLEDDVYPAGHVDNLSELTRCLKRHKLLQNVSGKWAFEDEFGVVEAARQKDLLLQIEQDPEMFKRVWRQVVLKETGYYDGRVSLRRDTTQGKKKAPAGK